VARWAAVRREVEAWEGDLAGRPEIVVLSRADLLDDAARAEAIAALRVASGSEPIALSSATGLGLDALRLAMGAAVTAATLAEPGEDAP
jgi:GTP-binding protein